MKTERRKLRWYAAGDRPILRVNSALNDPRLLKPTSRQTSVTE
jgi:hypothetical protein